ncbi:MAG: NAD-dependent epimerase [Armatimonadetes bacterium]|nr:NAD-dependent epimerase [Armatimonadota bacterium]
MTVLVTGAAGFVGFHFARRLLADGLSVVGLDNLNAYYEVRLKRARLELLEAFPGFRFVEADIAGGLERIFEEVRPRVVAHLAAQAGVRHSIKHPEDYVRSNLVGFANVLEACRHHNVGHLIYASSSSVYGNSPNSPFSARQPVDHPISLYAATKKSNELMAHSYSHLFGLPTTGLRFFTVYGPYGRPDMAYFSFTKAIFEGRPIDVYNHGQMQRDFTYVDDVVEGMVRLVERPPAPEPAAADPSRSASAPYRVYNIGNHQPVTLMHFIEVLEACIGKEAEKRMLEMQPGDVLSTCADVEDLARDVGFAPSTPIEVGLARFVDWYRAFYEAD